MKWMWWNLVKITECSAFHLNVNREMRTIDAYQIYPSINLLKSRAQPKNISCDVPRTLTYFFFPFAMKWANKFNYYSDRLMEALSTHFPFVFVRVHSFLSSRNKSVAAIVYWTMIKINFHNKISRNEAKNKATYNEIQWPIVLCRTVSRT